MPLQPHDGLLRVHLLGLVDLGAWLGLQEQNVYELSGRQDREAVLLLGELPPQITIGREGSRAQILCDDDALEQRGLSVQWVARGGGACIHAPGQLAIALQAPLQRLGIGLTGYRALLEQAVAETSRDVKIGVRRTVDHPGLWSRGGQVASFGGSVKSWITCHGMFLNVAIDPRWLSLLAPTVPETRWTSMQSQRLDPVRMARVRESLIQRIAEQFGYAQLDLATGHPQLRRTRKLVPAGP